MNTHQKPIIVVYSTLKFSNHPRLYQLALAQLSEEHIVVYCTLMSGSLFGSLFRLKRSGDSQTKKHQTSTVRILHIYEPLLFGRFAPIATLNRYLMFLFAPLLIQFRIGVLTKFRRYSPSLVWILQPDIYPIIAQYMTTSIVLDTLDLITAPSTPYGEFITSYHASACIYCMPKRGVSVEKKMEVIIWGSTLKSRLYNTLHIIHAVLKKTILISNAQ